MKKTYLLIFLFILAFNANAQQIGMYSHYYYKPMVYNPAFTGNSNTANIFLISRNQWINFKNSPQMNIASIDGNLGDKAGLGFTLITDRKGLNNRTGGNIAYSYRLNITANTLLRFGISVGVIDQTMDYSKAIVESTSDPAIFNDVQRKTIMDGNAGLAFTWENLEAGVAVPQIIGNKVKFVDEENIRSYYSQTRHYMGSVKYKMSVAKDKGLSLTPLILVRYLPQAPLQYDININLDWNDKLWLGATYKNEYAISANIGIRIHKQLYIGYAYDFIIGPIGSYSGMTHELMVNFKFNKKEKTVTPVVITKEGNRTLENKLYEKRMDSLQVQLKQNQEKINELTKKIEQQSSQQTLSQPVPAETIPVHNNDNQNAVIVADNTSNKIMEEGVWILTNLATDFKDAEDHEPEKGFYVIVGTFYYRDFAIAETKRFTEKGYHPEWVYYPAKEFNYVYTDKVSTKDEAIQKAKELQSKGIRDAWVQELVK